MINTRWFIFFTYFILLFNLNGKAQLKSAQIDALKSEAIRELDNRYGFYKETALEIWNYAELGYKEVKSSALLQSILMENGFKVEKGVAGLPTAFVATYGVGKPVIAILAEFDALPGLAQEATPEKNPIPQQIAGHACGHHLFGTASVAAGVAIKKMIKEKKLSGTVRVYGCPAEEGGSGKVFMVRAGLFNDVDIAIHWHPGDNNAITITSALANKSAKFHFKGLSAHAASAPEKGRSALDGVESMDYMVNMMREHVPEETRIHYVITEGGKAPNVVPDYAEVYYYVRHPKKDEVIKIFDRVVKAAEGAALGTGTTVNYDIIGGTHDLLLNSTLAQAMQLDLEKVGGVTLTDEEKTFGKKLQSTYNFAVPDLETAAKIKPLKTIEGSGGGSTDVGDVSYTVPTVGMRAATWIPGTPAHSWQAVACGGTEIGTKGMMVAAKTMALMTIDLFTNPLLVEKAKQEFLKDIGDYKYSPLLGKIDPALNYRD